MAAASYITLGVAGYLLLVRLLRYRALDNLQSSYRIKYGSKTPFESMTFTEAQAIINHMAMYEFPFTFLKSLQFALFRTYGIPTISSLLRQTSLLSSPKTSSKRYTDTVVLIADFMVGSWGGQRWREGLARMNCIHEPYIKSGKISNDDLLLTLSLFAGEPVRWIKQFEWRELTQLELCALGVFWKGVGDAMGIRYDVLPAGKTGWRDGAHWLEEVVAWQAEYERQKMVPCASNHEVAEETTAILLWSVPGPLKPLGKEAVSALMDERLRRAMQYEDPRPAVSSIVIGLLHVRAFVVQHFFLPRPKWMPFHQVTMQPDAEGRYFSNVWESLPFYVKPTLWNRWLSPAAWVARLASLPVPGKEYYPQGYVPAICGPRHGLKQQERMEEVVQEVGMRSCPVAFA